MNKCTFKYIKKESQQKSSGSLKCRSYMFGKKVGQKDINLQKKEQNSIEVSLKRRHSSETEEIPQRRTVQDELWWNKSRKGEDKTYS
jgi:hypothetical protein